MKAPPALRKLAAHSRIEPPWELVMIDETGDADRLRRPRRTGPGRHPAARGDLDSGSGVPDHSVMGVRAGTHQGHRRRPGAVHHPASALASPPPPTSIWSSATEPGNAAHSPTRSPEIRSPRRVSGSSSTRAPPACRSGSAPPTSPMTRIDELVERCAAVGATRGSHRPRGQHVGADHDQDDTDGEDGDRRGHRGCSGGGTDVMRTRTPWTQHRHTRGTGPS